MTLTVAKTDIFKKTASASTLPKRHNVPLFVLRSMNSGIRSHSESQTKESRKRLYLQTVTEGDIQYESFPISVCV